MPQRISGRQIEMKGHRLENVGDPIAKQDASTKYYVDTTEGLYNLTTFRRIGTQFPERWYSSVFFGQFYSTSYAANTIFLSPFIVSKSCRIDRLGIRVASAPVKPVRLRLGVYNDSGEISPKNCLVDQEIIATLATAYAVPISLFLTRSIYWLALLPSAAISIFGSEPWGVPAILGVSPGLGGDYNGGENASGWYVSYPYGKLPEFFPADASFWVARACIFIRISEYTEE